jgi:splicing factor 3A subunit 1
LYRYATVLAAPKKEEYSVLVPAGITSMDLDIIKLTAQFVARNGGAVQAECS